MQCLKISLVTIILGSVAGCSFVNPRLADGIREGQKQYARGNYIGAERLLTDAISKDPQSPAVAEAYYIRGLARLKLLQHSIAEQDFRRALRLAARDDLKANAHVCLGSMAFEHQEWDTAYKHYRLAESQLPVLSPGDWILFRLACSAQRSGRWNEGKKYFARILREYPDSDVARVARRDIGYEYFTIQTGAFASQQGAYLQFNQIKRYGLPVRIEVINKDSRSLRAVYVGRYNDYYQASKGLIKVKGIVPDARIVP